MEDENSNTDLILTSNQNYQVELELELRKFEQFFLSFIEFNGLPSEGVLISGNERSKVFRNIKDVIDLLPSDKRSRSIYISKFIAAVASGLFDAALNYLWNETISELRQRIVNYDLPYFFDNAVKNPEKRKRLSSEKDLEQIDDFELIQGARAIELISDIGYRQLDLIRDMRNHASAAHPNQNEITGFKLIDWLETCIKEVISLPEPVVVAKIKILLANIKKNSIDDTSAEQIAATFGNFTSEQVNALASGFFGIYTKSDTTSQTRENIHRLLPNLWSFVDESMRQQFGLKFGHLAINGDQNGEVKLARQFLQVVSAEAYIPDNFRAVEVKSAVENLLNAHHAMQNFYNEPPFARALQRLVGEGGTVPRQVVKIYVLGLVEVFLGNQYGVSNQAVGIYEELIRLFDERQATIAILSFADISISSKLQFERCERRFHTLLNTLKIKISSRAVQDFIVEIETHQGQLSHMKDTFKQKVTNLQKIRGLI